MKYPEGYLLFLLAADMHQDRCMYYHEYQSILVK